MKLLRLTAAFALAGIVLVGCAPAEDPATAFPSPVSTAGPQATAHLEAELASIGSSTVRPGARLAGPTALSVLKTLPVKGKAPKTGYNRNAKFGNGWKDFGSNRCDERQDTLSRDLYKVRFKDTKHCTVASGTLYDLYTGKAINWKVKAGSIDIDHVVALGNVWVSGGQKLSQAQRQAVANDPLNLMASAASANRQKGDRNAAEWLPANRSFRCQYVGTQISVKKKYALSVTASEKTAMTRVLNGCKTQKAAKVRAIKPAGAPGTNATKTAVTSIGKVSPGAYCKAADRNRTGTGKTNGKKYSCKASKTDTRLRWRV